MSTKTDWDAALIAAGFTDRRSAKGGASWTALAQAVGVHTSTLTAMRDGTRDTDGATIEKVADALRMDVREVTRWVGKSRSESEPYTPPKAANLLDKHEREAVDRIIELLAKSKVGKRGVINFNESQAGSLALALG